MLPCWEDKSYCKVERYETGYKTRTRRRRVAGDAEIETMGERWGGDAVVNGGRKEWERIYVEGGEGGGC